MFANSLLLTVHDVLLILCARCCANSQVITITVCIYEAYLKSLICKFYIETLLKIKTFP